MSTHTTKGQTMPKAAVELPRQPGTNAAANPAPRDTVVPKERKADLAKLEELQGEYDKLKTASERSVAKGKGPDAETIAKKGEVTRAMDVIKRKYDLP